MGSRRSYGSFYAVDFWCQVEGKVVWCGCGCGWNDADAMRGGVTTTKACD